MLYVSMVGQHSSVESLENQSTSLYNLAFATSTLFDSVLLSILRYFSNRLRVMSCLNRFFYGVLH